MLEAVHQPKEVAVVHCRGPQKGDSEIIQGSKAADQAANPAGSPTGVFIPSPLPLPQPKYTEKDKACANKKNFSLDDSRWYLLDGILAIPQNLQWKLVKALHDSIHLGQDASQTPISRTFQGKGLSQMVQQITSCPTCTYITTPKAHVSYN